MDNNGITQTLIEGMTNVSQTLLSLKTSVESIDNSVKKLSGTEGVVKTVLNSFKKESNGDTTMVDPFVSITESLQELTKLHDTLFAANAELETVIKTNTEALTKLTNLLSNTTPPASPVDNIDEGFIGPPMPSMPSMPSTALNEALAVGTGLGEGASLYGLPIPSMPSTALNEALAGGRTRQALFSDASTGHAAPLDRPEPVQATPQQGLLSRLIGSLTSRLSGGGDWASTSMGFNGISEGGAGGAGGTGDPPDHPGQGSFDFEGGGFFGKLKDSVGASLTALGGGPALAMEAGLKLAKMAIEKLTETLHEMNDISERLSVVNTNLHTELKGNTESLEKNTVGFGLAVKALAELRVAGFDKTNANLINLATRTKISGQDFGAVVKLGQDIIATGSHQEDVMDGLSKNIVDNSLKYGTTTDSMVKAVGQLSENFQLLSVMGGLDTATGVTADLTARLGQENSQLVGSLMKELTSANANLNMQAILGVEGLGDQLAMGNIGTQEAIQGIIEGSKVASRLQGAAANTSRRALSATFGGTDKFLTNLRIVGEKLENAQKPAIAMWDALKNTLSVFKEIVMDPLKNIAVGLLKPFQLLIGGLSLLVGSIMNLIVRAFGPAIAAVMDIVGVVAGAIGFVIQGVAGVVEGIYDVLSMIPGLGRWFGDADSDKNSTFNSMNKLLESINGMASDSLALDAGEARAREKDMLERETPLTGPDIWTEAALADVDYKLRRMEETKQEMLNKVLTKLLEQGDAFKGKDIVSAVKETTAALIGTQVNPFATGNI